MFKTRNLTMVLMATVTAACGGYGTATVDGDVGGAGFVLSTVYAWIDATTTETSSTGETKYKVRDSATLQLYMSGASFDPESDLRFIDAVALAQIQLDELTKGSVRVSIAPVDKLSAGQQLSTSSDGSDPEAPRLSVSSRYSEDRVEADAEYPIGGSPPVQSGDSEWRLELDTMGRERGESIAGKLTLEVKRADGDPSNAATGRVEITFDAPIIGERIAERNFSRIDR